MKLVSARSVPFIIIAAAVALVCLCQVGADRWPAFRLLERLESMAYDWRVRWAYEAPHAVSDKLGFVFIGDDAIDVFSGGQLGTNLQFGLKWPHQVYGRVVRELKAQGAGAVAMDVLFGERRPDHPRVATPAGAVDSDRYFQSQLMQAGNVFLGATREVVPHPMFRLGAQGMGDISIDCDSDGVLRRVKAFQDYRIWHPEIRAEARLRNWQLPSARVETNHISFPAPEGKTFALDITEEGYFDPTELAPAKKRGGVVRLQKAYEDLRVWHLGIALAARALNLELDKARVDLKEGQIVLAGSNKVERILPVDRQGRFLIDWSLKQTDKALTREAFESVVAKDVLRQLGTNNITARFRDKYVVLGSVATGNELSDRGATPLEKDTFLTSNNWNVANSMLTGRFIQPCSTRAALSLICIMGLTAGGLTLRLRIARASFLIGLLCTAYILTTVWMFVQHRLWIPMVAPVGAVLLTHFALVSYHAIFEQAEKRRIKGIFSRIVSPNVVQELIKAPDLSLIGARRQVTVMFTDVRGFTEMTDRMHAEVEEHVKRHQLSEAEAQVYSDARAQEILETVNQYLGLIADTVKEHEGTLDKYIGDCVMAFWGAPTPNEKHGLACVRAAIESQRAIFSLNQERAAENKRRQEQNKERLSREEEALPLLHLLSLGAGVNTGVVTVGLMGSESHIQNYTVFGREVNLAARLEPLSGRGRILIGEATYQELLRDDPELAATCFPWDPVPLKGFKTAIRVYEVPWSETLQLPSADTDRLKKEAGTDRGAAAAAA